MNLADFKALVEQRGPVVRDGGDWRGRCPVHADDGKRGDLTFRAGDDGRIILHCWGGCDAKSVVSSLGLQWSDLFSENGHSRPRATQEPKKQPRIYPTYHGAVEAVAARLGGSYVRDWTYHSVDGDEAMYIVRFTDPRSEDGKRFVALSPAPGGGIMDCAPPAPRPLYNLPALLADSSSPVFVVEGEKCSDAGRKIGLLTTTSVFGSGSADKADWSPLAGRDCIILPDCDKAGETYAEKVAGILLSLTPPASVKIVRLPGLSVKGDLADYVEQSEAEDVESIRANILSLAAETPVTQPPQKVTKPPVEIQNAEEPTRKLALFDAATWFDSEPPPADQILGNMFDRGDKVAIIGASKCQKSFFLLQAALCLAAGRDFLGWSVPKRRKVVLIQMEIQAHHFWRRGLRMAKALEITRENLEGWLYVGNGRGLSLAGAAGAEQIRNVVLDHAPDLICLDPLYKLTEGKENASEDMKTTLALFDKLAEETGAAVLYVHHDAKGNPGDRPIQDRGSGSGVLGRDEDARIAITQHASEDDARVVETMLRNYRPQKPITIGWYEGPGDSHCFTVRPDLAPTPKTSTTTRQNDATTFDNCRQIAQQLLLGGVMRIGDFRERLGVKAGIGQKRIARYVKKAFEMHELDYHDVRGDRKHDKYIGTPEQIECLRSQEHDAVDPG